MREKLASELCDDIRWQVDIRGRPDSYNSTRTIVLQGNNHVIECLVYQNLCNSFTWPGNAHIPGLAVETVHISMAIKQFHLLFLESAWIVSILWDCEGLSGQKICLSFVVRGQWLCHQMQIKACYWRGNLCGDGRWAPMAADQTAGNWQDIMFVRSFTQKLSKTWPCCCAFPAESQHFNHCYCFGTHRAEKRTTAK
jgi:hypothetical protein